MYTSSSNVFCPATGFNPWFLRMRFRLFVSEQVQLAYHFEGGEHKIWVASTDGNFVMNDKWIDEFCCQAVVDPIVVQTTCEVSWLKMRRCCLSRSNGCAGIWWRCVCSLNDTWTQSWRAPLRVWNTMSRIIGLKLSDFADSTSMFRPKD